METKLFFEQHSEAFVSKKSFQSNLMYYISKKGGNFWGIFEPQKRLFNTYFSPLFWTNGLINLTLLVSQQGQVVVVIYKLYNIQSYIIYLSIIFQILVSSQTKKSRNIPIFGINYNFEIYVQNS